jgi:uncharacterized protein (UPF0332 family)
VTEEIRALVQYRLGEAREALEEAEILLASQKHRGAMNRVYYAMFYGVLALLASRGLSAAKHSGAISTFHREFVKPGTIPVEVAKFLDIAFDLRNKCDYRDFVSPEPERVQELLAAARTFVAEVQAALASDEAEP